MQGRLSSYNFRKELGHRSKDIVPEFSPHNVLIMEQDAKVPDRYYETMAKMIRNYYAARRYNL
jgi:hypothetical protein